jgi:hypothetical protein
MAYLIPPPAAFPDLPIEALLSEEDLTPPQCGSCALIFPEHEDGCFYRLADLLTPPDLEGDLG